MQHKLFVLDTVLVATAQVCHTLQENQKQTFF